MWEFVPIEDIGFDVEDGHAKVAFPFLIIFIFFFPFFMLPLLAGWLWDRFDHAGRYHPALGGCQDRAALP